jgi:hypothetical protein
LRLVIVPDSHVCLGHIPERCLGVDDRVVEATEVRRSRDLLVAGIALALCDGGVGSVCVAAPVVEVCKVEAVVREEGAVASDGRDLVGVDGDDGVVDSGTAAVHAAHEAE